MKRKDKASNRSDADNLLDPFSGDDFESRHATSNMAWVPDLAADNYRRRDDLLVEKIEGHTSDIKKLDHKVRQAQQRYTTLTAELERATNAIDKREAEAKREAAMLKEELSRDRYRAIEVLALFVAFFTFVSVEFQLFANLTKLWQILSLTLVLLGALVLFVILLSRIVSGDKVRPKRKSSWEAVKDAIFDSKLLILSVFMVLAGIVIMAVYRGDELVDESFIKDKSGICRILANDIVSEAGAIRQKSLDSYEKLGCNGAE